MLAAAVVVLPGAGPAASATSTIGITRTGFAPADVTIAAGDTVTWENRDTADHQVASRQAGFTSPVLKPGQTFSFTFREPGRFNYEDPLQRRPTRGTVTVTAPTVTATLVPSGTLVAYGRRVTLTGAVSSGRANERVEILARLCGTTTPTRVAAVQTSTGGAYAVVVQPLRNTAYSARVGSTVGPARTVLVRPRLTLVKVAPRRFTVTARASTSLSGRAVVLQRWDGAARVWRNVRTSLLVRGPAATAPTVLSRATFSVAVKPRTRLRVTLTQLQAGSCYRPSLSNAVLA